ncbi:hypothetical protein ACXR2U_08770 [Jatrophihabitans sp. YIM 134969]
MYTRSVEYNGALDKALGHGPEGPTYRPPAARKRTVIDRVKAWAWYRWGWGHRPGPSYVLPTPAKHETRGQRRRRSEVDDQAA